VRSLRWLRWQGAPPADEDAISLAMAMVALPVVLGLLGWWIDGLLGTGPVFLALLAGFGIASSFASARYRYERRIAQHDEGKPWTRSRPKAAS
jgi:F0F1-type ATP synthase assembly protein I